MEGAAAEPGLFRCLLCAWEAPSRLAVLHHLRAPAHRDAQAQRRLQLLQSGPAAAEDGLSGLHSILSFSHGQLPTPGEQGPRWAQEGGAAGLRGGAPGHTGVERSRDGGDAMGFRGHWGSERCLRRVEKGSGPSSGQEQEQGPPQQPVRKERGRKPRSATPCPLGPGALADRGALGEAAAQPYGKAAGAPRVFPSPTNVSAEFGVLL